MKTATTSAPTNELQKLGYAVLPAPRRVTLAEGNVRLDAYWGLSLAGIGTDDIAVTTLQRGLNELLGLRLAPATGKAVQLSLAVQPGTIRTGFADGRDTDAYALDIKPGQITLTGNGKPGLFYAVQTLLQLAEGNGQTPGQLPVGRIEDWPQYERRSLHWDTKHHQDRMETLKRYLDQSARFKINTIIYELEDKFAYPSHPVIGAPGAWTPAELQSLVDYGLERHIQIIPDVQSPAHLTYVLKHKEFEHLRCDGNNYQICMDNPEARKLLFDMYDDVCAATKGVNFFLVSTDEVYYAGICEKYRKPYTPESRSLAWVDYVNAAHAHLSPKGRQVIVWAEYPLLPEHISLLPKDLINGNAGSSQFLAAEKQHGMRQFAYTSVQGEELLFPDLLPCNGRDGRPKPGRLTLVRDALSRGHQVMPFAMGTVGGSWDDSGLHNETFWLGWAAVAQCSWTPEAPADELIRSFMALFHGRELEGMLGVYKDLQLGVRFYENSFERLPSIVRGPGYGSSDAKRPINRTDRGLLPPALPDPATLAIEPAFQTKYSAVLAEAPFQLKKIRQLQNALATNLARARRNRYNLEVYQSLTWLIEHHLEMVQTLATAETTLVGAAVAAKRGDQAEAVGLLKESAAKVRGTMTDLDTTYARIQAVWEKSRFPKGQSVGARTFLHVMDDVKDHVADRTPDLGYLIMPEKRIGLADWVAKLERIAADYARAHGVPAPG